MLIIRLNFISTESKIHEIVPEYKFSLEHNVHFSVPCHYENKMKMAINSLSAKTPSLLFALSENEKINDCNLCKFFL